METHLFLGIDLGTTGCKVILLNANGKILDKGYAEYPILSPQPGYAEQDPEAWWGAVCQITRELTRRNIEAVRRIIGIGICGQMHTQVYLDQHQNIVRPAITWMDQRSQPIVAELRKNDDTQRLIFKNTANFATNTYTAPKVAWVKRFQPEIFNGTAKILIAKDFIKYKMTGEMITDFSDAAGTLFFDVVKKRWSQEMFDLFAIERDLMPEVSQSAVIIGQITQEASAATGLPAGIPVINGCADHTAHALGSGIYRAGQTTMQIGTSGAINACTDKPVVDPLYRAACWNYCLEDRWVTLGLTQTAGKSLDWFKAAFDQNSSSQVFSLYEQEIAKVPDGCEDLIYLPYLMGERSPHWDPYARGVFFGISLNHHKYHFVKAVLEGVAFSLRQNLEIVESLGIGIDSLKLLGGASKSLEWKGILAKVLNKKIVTSPVEETGARGSSILCGLALGLYQSPDGILAQLTDGDQTEYCPEFPPVYRRSYQIYQQLYSNLKDLYPKDEWSKTNAAG